jgi:hypothetical protein
MAFTVETGTGAAGANSFTSVAEFKAYHAERGTDITAITGDTAIQRLLVKGADYIEKVFGMRFKGSREFSTQSLSFPRVGLYTNDGFPVTGIPGRLKWAQAEYALQANSGDLFITPPASTTGGAIIRTKDVVGPIEVEVEYAAGGVQEVTREYPVADSWLQEYLTPGGTVIRA